MIAILTKILKLLRKEIRKLLETFVIKNIPGEKAKEMKKQITHTKPIDVSKLLETPEGIKKFREAVKESLEFNKVYIMGNDKPSNLKMKIKYMPYKSISFDSLPNGTITITYTDFIT